MASIVVYLGSSSSLALEALDLLPSSSFYNSVVSYSSGELVYLERVEPEFIKDVCIRPSKSSNMLLAGDHLCVFTDSVQKSGVYSNLFICTLSELGRSALYTSSPPRASSKNPRAILALYVKKLLSSGASLEKLAAKLATSSGGRGVVISPIPYSSSSYGVVFGVDNSAYLCIKYTDSGILARLSTVVDQRYRCYSGKVFVFRLLSGGIIRVESRSMESVY